jgi:two-component system, cell cycle sensor histidine kinase and response regulator CckA
MSETAIDREFAASEESRLVGTCFMATVLLVEDEQFVREGASEALRSAGYLVVAARDAAEARRIYRQMDGAVDLLMTDVVLPGESGRDLARSLKCRKQGLKILFMSAYTDQIAMSHASLDEFLAKPFSVEGLLRQVAKALGRVNFSYSEEDPSGSFALPGKFENLGGDVGEREHTS